MYPEPENIWQSIEYSSLGIAIAESTWAFPTLETIHVIALITVVGTIAIMDVRLLGWASMNTRVTQLSNDLLKWTWGAFVLAAITGGLLFISKASTYMVNPYFLIKMGLLVLAGLNMLLFHFVTFKSVANWDNAQVMPTGAKVAGALSLLFWGVIIFMGRAIGFTLGILF
jgi:uncharacterized membrane protein